MQPTRRPPFPCLGRPPPPYLSFREESSTPSPCWKTREARKGEEHTLFKKGTKAWAPDRSWGRPPGQPSLLSKDAWGEGRLPLGPFARLRPGRTGGRPKKDGEHTKGGGPSRSTQKGASPLGITQRKTEKFSLPQKRQKRPLSFGASRS